VTRVIHVITGLGTGGAELALLRLVRHPHPAIEHMLVIALSPGGAQADRFRACGIPVLELDFRGRPFRSFFRLVQTLRRLRPGVVQTWLYHADLIGGLAARWAGCKTVIWGIRTTHLVPSAARATRVVRWICARLSSTVPRAILCAAEASRQVHVALGYDPSRMVVIPNGYDFSLLRADPGARDRLRTAWGLTPDEVAVGIVGRFNTAKDHETFVKAAGKVAEIDTSARFILIGRDLDAANRVLISWIQSTGHVNRFTLLGERTDVPDCLSAMDGFCLSSRTEGFPNVVAEAMALGLPCVVTDVGDAAFLLGGHGWVVPKENPGAMAAALTALVRTDAEDRRRLGAAARARVEGEFTVARMADRLADLYLRLLPASGNRPS
jgi:glycosyltransferase involved in cell wall biosynthesis